MPLSPLSRREFCSVVGAAGLTAVGTRVLAAQRSAPPLRIIAYNVYACKGWPEDRPLAKKAVEQGQMVGRMAMELSLYEPDIINFSESPSQEIAEGIASLLKMKSVRFPSGGNWPGTLLTRFEMRQVRNVPLAEGERPEDLFTRHWGRATIVLPEGEELIVHSAHLHPAPDPSIRLREVAEMVKAMQPELDAGRSMLLIGDLNHRPDTTEYRMWMEAGWVDTFAKVGEGDGYTIKSDDPQSRIDYVMAAGPIASRIQEARPLFQGAFRVHADDPQGFALSDHLPQFARFGGA